MDLLSEKKLHKIARIDQAAGDFFNENPSVKEIPAKDLMPLFIKKGIFLNDYEKGSPIRLLLRHAERQDKLHLLKQVKVERNAKSKCWYFAKK